MTQRRGFTLFELVVALGLSVALMAMIGVALRFYAQTLDARNTDVRRTQLARAVLQMISEDLRACVRPEEFDAAELEAILQSSAGSGAGGESSASETGEEDASLAETEGEVGALTTDLAAGVSLTARPGLLGNQNQIQFDISRLPRQEEYWALMNAGDGTEMADVPSDLKTVAYYVQPAGAEGAGDTLSELEGTLSISGGLVRRELDRAVTSWAMTSGSLQVVQRSGEVLAPEVVSLEFSYWDGLQWVYEWNSDEYDALPLAVQVRLTLRLDNASAPPSGGEAPGIETYDMIVPLPTARPSPATEMAPAASGSSGAIGASMPQRNAAALVRRTGGIGTSGVGTSGVGTGGFG